VTAAVRLGMHTSSHIKNLDFIRLFGYVQAGTHCDGVHTGDRHIIVTEQKVETRCA
jgi:hypothetical protein